jgi:hypothetical protein
MSIDARKELVNWLHGVAGMTAADIRNIPADKWSATFGGATRPVDELVADSLAFAAWVAKAINGEVLPYDGNTIETMRAEMPTPEAGVAKVKEVAALLAEAISSHSDEELMATIDLPWGQQSLYSTAQTAVSHLWYHDGQLNYVQALLGDGEVHWMEA